MISQETKDIIEKEASIWANLLYTFETGKRYGERGYIEGATKYAEKLEEKDKEIASLNAKLFIKKNAEQELESKNSELTELKSWHDYYKERAEKGEGILKSATDIHFVPGKEGDNLLAAKDRELARLKEELSKLKNEKI